VVENEMSSSGAPSEIDRGFGLEFEMVGREIPPEIIDEIKADGKIKYAIGEHVFNGGLSFLRWARPNATRPYFKALERKGLLDYMAILEAGNAFTLPAFEKCFRESTTDPELVGKTCSSNSDCALSQFCMSCDACYQKHKTTASWSSWAKKLPTGLPFSEALANLGNCKGCSAGSPSVCKMRANCQEGMPVGNAKCPVALKAWQWTMDPSVHPLTKAEARLLGSEDEAKGQGFELVSPPLSGKEGMRSALEVMAILKGMGIQAGPSSGMHVHVNVASPKVPGKLMSPRQIAGVWVAFAKFQLVIDEFFSPSRLGNSYARRLFLGNCEDAFYQSDVHSHSGACSAFRPCTCAKHFFKNIHGYVNDKSKNNEDVADFCNTALTIPGSPTPCNHRIQPYPDQRYYSLNLVPLSRLGTIEFRAHSATYDLERVQRWTEFAVAFVEHFGNEPDFAKYFFDGHPHVDLQELSKAQREATADELFAALKGKINEDTQSYFESRSWERDATGCDITAPGMSEEEAAEEFEANQAIQQAIGDGQLHIESDDEDEA